MANRDINGVQLHYTEQGPATGPAAASKSPVVLLHGFPLDSRMWEAQLSALAGAGRRVIAPDLRGFGKSRSDAPFTIESLADDLHALLGAVGALPCVLAGLSMGGYVALAYAKKYPSDLRGLVLVDTKAEADTAEGKQGRAKMIDLVRKEGSKAVADQMMPKMLAKDAADQRPQMAQALRQMMEACPPRTIENALAAMRDRPDRSGELSSIKVPTLVVVGDGDAITPPAVAQSMAEKIPGAQLVTIRGAGHMSPMEQPEQVNRAMRTFVDGLRG
jgi:pimeloyl-ACP methyl ester carboxylesterase